MDEAESVNPLINRFVVVSRFAIILNKAFHHSGGTVFVIRHTKKDAGAGLFSADAPDINFPASLCLKHADILNVSIAAIVFT